MKNNRHYLKQTFLKNKLGITKKSETRKAEIIYYACFHY